MPTEKSTDGTAALDKALDVLDAIGASPAGLSQQALAERLALPRTTLYRLLGRLVARGLLRRDPLRRVYGLGMRCFEYARAAYSMPDLVAAAGPELRALRDMTGETTYLATLDGLETVSLERCDGAHGQRSHAALGQRKPLHCTSQGKAMLAALPAAERDTIVRDLALSANTPRTITDRRRLQAELKLTATRGWSIDDEEITLGVRCCGAAIVDGQGHMRGAISVAGPAFRLTTERLALIGPEVADAARRIGAQLAARAPAAARVEGEVQVIDGPWAFDGAAPCWQAAAGALYWADRLAPSVHRATGDGDRLLVDLDAPIQHLLPHADGVLVQTADHWRCVGRDGALRDAPGLPRRRIAAACTSPDGRLWACQADGDRWRIAAIDATGRTAGAWRLAEPATALAWDGSGSSLAIATTSGSLYLALPGSSAMQRLATVPKGSGLPSGLARDAAGGVWTALRGGWSAVRFEADGTLDRVVALPVPCPTDLGFGGPGARTLYITSARDAVSREALDAAPLSGRLFALAGAADGVVPAPIGSA